MSWAEAEAVERTGFLRGGIPGEVYWTDDLYESSAEAMRHLALANLPEVRMRFRIRGTLPSSGAARGSDPTGGNPAEAPST
jgi:hypothetical protein